MRKSKFDWFIFYDPKRDRIIELQWDFAVNGVPEWYVYDGNECQMHTGHGMIQRFRKRYVLLDRLPEGYGRARG